MVQRSDIENNISVAVYKVGIRKNVMHKLVLMLGIGALGACAVAPGDTAGGPADVATSVSTSASQAITPMGFARITATGSVILGFASGSSQPVTVSGSGGDYSVWFPGLGILDGLIFDGQKGNVQVTAEGTDNVRCQLVGWGAVPVLFAAPTLRVSVQCTLPNGSLAASGFAVLYYRYTMPASNTSPTSVAYMWRPVGATGVAAGQPLYDYNSSGTHNTVSGFGGSYTIVIPGATANNASMMVTSYGGTGATGAVCSIVNWGVPSVRIECRNPQNQLVDSAFSFSYSTIGPAQSQQSGHAWFNGTSADTSYSAGRGQCESTASVTGSRSNSLVTIAVSGVFGSFDATPFLRASFASRYGSAGYCKIESLTIGGTTSSSTAATTLRCYDRPDLWSRTRCSRLLIRPATFPDHADPAYPVSTPLPALTAELEDLTLVTRIMAQRPAVESDFDDRRI